MTYIQTRTPRPVLPALPKAPLPRPARSMAEDAERCNARMRGRMAKPASTAANFKRGCPDQRHLEWAAALPDDSFSAHHAATIWGMQYTGARDRMRVLAAAGLIRPVGFGKGGPDKGRVMWAKVQP